MWRGGKEREGEKDSGSESKGAGTRKESYLVELAGVSEE